MTQTASRPSASAPVRLSHADIRSILIGIMLAMLLAALDQTIVATALPTIGHSLGDMDDMPWVVTAYLLAATAVTPLYGKFSDIHGRRTALLIGIATFVVGSIACAVAPSMLVLIVARAVQGLGGGGLISLAQTIIADVLPPKERARYQVYIAGVFMTSSLAGPVLGGFLSEHLHWSVIFWINVPLGAAAYLLAGKALRKLPINHRPHRLDVLGAVLMTVATIALMLGLSWGGVRMPWSSAPVLSAFAVALVFSVLFAVRLARADEPLIPAALLRNGVVCMGTAAACFGMGTFIGLSIYLPVYFEIGLGLNASGSGLAMMPLMVSTVVGATIAGRAITMVARYKRIPVAGLVLAVVATAMMATFATVMPVWLVGVTTAVIGLGLGTVLPVTTIAVQNAVEPHQLGTATGLMNFFRQLGGAIIVAAFGAIVLADSGRAALGGAEGVSAASLTPRELLSVFPHVFAAAALGFACSLLFLILMKEMPMRGSSRRETHAAFAD